MKIGIDLGTTYSAAAYVDEAGVPRIIDNAEGAGATPSVVFFDEDGTIVVGEVAKDNSVINAKSVVSTVKNRMGEKTVLKKRDDIEYTPEMISSFILKKVVQDAESALGEKVTDVVITVPAYFSDAQRQATKDAADIAGIHLIGTINEPTAAALCYAKKNNVREANLLIYDLGGGTFDVTILRLDGENEMEVLATGGLSNAGGRFFDQYIVDYVVEYMDENHDIDLEDDEYKDDLQELYIKAENLKMQLSQRQTASMILKVDGVKEKIEITRAQFEEMIKRIYIRTESKMKETLKAAKLTVDDIDKVLLVGGSSRIPYIEESIEKFIGKAPSREINPDEAVALGAALYANMKVKLKDVNSHSIGIVGTTKEGTKENDILIPRNSKLPAEKEARYKTIVENQRKIAITVTEGEYKELTDVSIIGNFVVDLPSGLEKQTSVIIKISLDLNQLIHMHILVPAAGISEEYHMKREANMDAATRANLAELMKQHKVS